MRALILTPDYPPAPGGIQLVMEGLASNLRLAEPEVVTLRADGVAEREVSGGPEVIRVGRKRETANKLSTAALNLAGIWRGMRRRPDVVVGGHVVVAPATEVLARLRGVPVIQYVHADEFRKRPGLVRRSLATADAVIAVSRYSERLAVSAGCDPARVHVIHPGVNLPKPVDVPREDRPTVLTVARMQERYKGHDTMIRALPAILERVPDARWVVIGDGRLRPELEQTVRDAGLEGAVRFMGSLANRERDLWFARAHVFAMPSRLPQGGLGGEGFGIVYLEAAGHGLPVVAAAAGGAPDAVADGDTGILVPPGEPGPLAAAIAGLLAEPERAGAMGAAGRERAREFTWTRHSSRVENLMRALTSKA